MKAHATAHMPCGTAGKVLTALLAALLLAVVLPTAFGQGCHQAFAADSALKVGNIATSAATAGKTKAKTVYYVAILGADTWVNGNGTRHAPASDMTAVARIDVKTGTVSVLTFPRDMKYANMRKLVPKATVYKTNMVFRYAFNNVIKQDWSNYDQAIASAAKTTCKELTDITGIRISDYVVVDLNTYQTIVNKLGGVTVDIPLSIKNYRLYSNGKYYSVNKGKAGKAKLNGWNAMIASRNRLTYCTWTAESGYNIKYAKLADYKGNYPNLLIQKIDAKGKKEYWYHFDGDGTRQFLNRRTLGMLVNKGLDRSEGAWNFVWGKLVQGKLMWTNLTKAEVKALGNGLAKAKKNNKLVMYGASLISPDKGRNYTYHGDAQYLIPMDKANVRQKNAVLEQFRAGKPMTSGWADEVIIGYAKGAKKKVGGITYKVTSNSGVTVVKIPNKKKVTIPAKVKLNYKYYDVTALSASSMKGSKVRHVVVGANVKKIASKAFKGSKATKITLKTTLLTKAKVKNSLKGSVVKNVKVSVAKKKKAATLKRYKKYFTKKNTGAAKKLKVY